jgi:hypothetical protein
MGEDIELLAFVSTVMFSASTKKVAVSKQGTEKSV